MTQLESVTATPNESGDTVHWRVYQVPYETADGEVWLAGIAIDVTDELEREAALLQTQQELKEANAVLHAHALTDELTGLWNRRAFNLRIAQEVAAAHRTHTELGLILIDVDNFKLLNDGCGHAFGDQVLHLLGLLLGTHVRLEDIAARYGGEEFVLLIPRASPVALETLANRILTDIADKDWGVRPVTVSLGLASLSPTLNTPALLVDAADRALYAAKAAGKACWRKHCA